ncbi:hypothetical protein TeGR_g4361 [Tetraparma gracilis]|uniref:VASt domain-containing protein n=1 Tax=Tetraparma gracilis TaxID=2962635 RepID=A0ABQ6N888_9STRA|nr:hypothetical protein TeGR_g4361 [Tetraparma gracilis]
MPRFSPSLPPSSSFHGIGLAVATSRAQGLGRANRDAAQLLEDAAMARERKAKRLVKALEKAAELLPRPAAATGTAATGPEPGSPGAGYPSAAPEAGAAVFHASLLSYAKQSLFEAISTKGNVARPLAAGASLLATSAAAQGRRYEGSRAECRRRRAKQAKARRKYRNCARDVLGLYADLLRTFADSEDRREARRIEDARGREAGEGGAPPPPAGDAAPPGSPPPAPPLPPLPRSRAGTGEDEALKAHAGAAALPNPLSFLSAEPPLHRQTQYLYLGLLGLRRAEEEYRGEVEEDSRATHECVQAELSALDGLEEHEADRLSGFADALSRLVATRSGSLENMAAACERSLDPAPRPTLPFPPLKETFPRHMSSKAAEDESGEERRQRKGSYQNPIASSVQAEADAANLPPSVAQLRSDLLLFHRRSATTQTYTLGLKKLLETVLAAQEEYVLSLGQTLSKFGYPAPNVPTATVDPASLCHAMVKTEGRRALQAWSAIISSVLSEIKTASPLIAQLRDAISELGSSSSLSGGDKMLKSVKETGDAVWKGICEAGKQQAKAESRWRSAENEVKRTTEKLAQQRSEYEAEAEINSAAGVPPTTASQEDSDQFGTGLRKGVGNMLSFLGGGEDVMNKVLSTKERLEMSQADHDKACANLAQSKATRDSCQRAASDKANAYAASFEETFERLKKDEEDKEALCKKVFELSIAGFLAFVEGRKENTKFAAEGISAVQGGEILLDKTDWARKIERKIRKKNEEVDKNLAERAAETEGAGGEGGEGSGGVEEEEFDAKIHIEPSRIVYTLLSDGIGYKPEDLPPEVQGGGDTEEEMEMMENITTLIRDFATTYEQSAQLAANAKDSRVQSHFEHHFGPDMYSAHEAVGEEEEGQGSAEEGKGATSAAHTPVVIESFTCAYYPSDTSESLSPILHGRIFVTANAMYFVGWGNFKLVINLTDIAETSKETTAKGVVDNGLKLVTKQGATYFFGSFAFRTNCFVLVNRLRAVKGALIESGLMEEPPEVEAEEAEEEVGGEGGEAGEEGGAGGGEEAGAEPAAPGALSAGALSAGALSAGALSAGSVADTFSPASLPKDAVLGKMTQVAKGKLEGVNTPRYFELFWAEKKGASEFYAEWLRDTSNKDVAVGPWTSGSFPHAFSGETFSMKRVTTFSYKRTTHLYVGPPWAEVKQTQLARVDEGNRCVVVFTVDMSGIPFSDVFSVEIRWTATNSSDRVIEVEAGCAVVLHKYSLVSSKIKSGTLEETTPAQVNLLEAMRKKVAQVAAVQADAPAAAQARPPPAAAAPSAPPPAAAQGAGGPLAALAALLAVAVLLLVAVVLREGNKVGRLEEQVSELARNVNALVTVLAKERGVDLAEVVIGAGGT